ncbi:ABC transporter ATP-binding protein [Ilumatobacter sp.]|uniref:ABC transporter ATP-binding protein n=1 Tax=Ilumatobacter sp. TaxID=1967498 RepID=UPI003B528965
MLQVRDLNVDFVTQHGWVNVVRDVNFDLARGETLGLVGESGSGKSVTSMAIMGLVPEPPGRVQASSIRLGDTDLLTLPRKRKEDLRGNRLAMIFQEPMTSLNPAFTIGEQIAEVVRRHEGASRKDATKRAVEVLGDVGIPNPARRATSYPHEFSGGMRQRAVIAMALACRPDVVIADEPTTALDVTIQAQILDLLREMQEEMHMAILFITHDLGVVADLCDRVAVMYAGQVVERAEIETLFEEPRHPYSDALLRSMPQVGSKGEKLSSIPGKPPEPWAFSDGCRFGPRCEHREAACDAHPIELRDLSGGGELRQSRCRRVHELYPTGVDPEQAEAERDLEVVTRAD